MKGTVTVIGHTFSHTYERATFSFDEQAVGVLYVDIENEVVVFAPGHWVRVHAKRETP